MPRLVDLDALADSLERDPSPENIAAVVRELRRLVTPHIDPNLKFEYISKDDQYLY